MDTIWSAVDLGEYVGLYEVIYPIQSEGGILSESVGSIVTVSEDAAEIEAFYEILSSLTCYGSGRWDLIDLGNWEVAADSAVNYDSNIWSRVLVERYLTITTDYGNEIDGLKYTAYSDMFYEFSGIAYSTLNEEQAELICEILGIDADGTVSSSVSDAETEVSVDSAGEDGLPSWAKPPLYTDSETEADAASDSASGTTVSLAYVTDLQEKISAAMTNGELPHVSSSSVYENPYRLHVTVLPTITDEEMEKLQAYDTLGALKIEVSDTEISRE